MIEDALNIYTDGSSYSRPRVGGIGVLFVWINEFGSEETEEIAPPGHPGASSVEMELYACIFGLKEALKHPKLATVNKVAIHTDSKYIVDNYSRAVFEWSKSKWLNRDGKPIENADLWKKLIKSVIRIHRQVRFYWVKGHSTDRYNKAADKLAKRSAKNPFSNPLYPTVARRKLSSNSTERGSVGMHGQRMSVRIITANYLKQQRLNRYRYEVISKKSRYFGKVDMIYSKEHLKPGHHYEISVNKNAKNPRILKMLRELER